MLGNVSRMHTFRDQYNCCTRHPHQRVVGVCASCLRERLAGLEESRIGADDDHKPSSSTHPAESPYVVPSHRRSPRPGFLDNSDVGLVHKEEPAHCSIQPKLKSDASIPLSTDLNYQDVFAHPKNSSLPTRRSNASETERPFKVGTDPPRGQKAWPAFQHTEDGREQHWKEKTGRIDSMIYLGDYEARSVSVPRDAQENVHLEQSFWAMRSPGISAGRKSTESIGIKSRPTYKADLETVAESRLSIDVDVKRKDHSSWITSLFQRRKPRQNSSSMGRSSTVGTSSGSNKGLVESARPSIDAGRRSLDTVRSNIRQILKKQEGKKQSPWPDPSPVELDFTKEGTNYRVDSQSGHKRRPIPSARSSISVEIPKEFQAVHPPRSPLPEKTSSRGDYRGVERCGDLCDKVYYDQKNSSRQASVAKWGMEETEDDKFFSRSRSSGRPWSRSLSPLWGFKQHNRKEEAFMQSNSTPDRVHNIPHHGVFPFSPLRKSRHA